MNKKDNWDSLYRKKMFYEKQRMKKEKQEYGECYYNSSFRKKEKRIAVMLDIEKTSEWITDETAEIFVSQLEKIRKQFMAEEGIICISTLDHSTERIKKVLSTLSRYTSHTIKIDLSFFYGGMYDFTNDYEWKTPINNNKVESFMDYMQDKNILWVAFIDDNLSLDTYKKYRNKLPTLVAIPSANKEKIEQNNFMQIATTTKNFDGVIEILASYLTTIQNLMPKDILQKQMSMPIHLSSWEVIEKVHEKNYPFLEQYFLSGCADEGDYSIAITWIGFNLKDKNITQEEKLQIKNILDLIEKQYAKNDDTKLDRVKRLKQFIF